jgi:hypothetical protein
VAFTVDDCKRIYEKAIARGAVSVREPFEIKVRPTVFVSDNGQVKM